ncbi:7665_t:CDS:2, partial [Dentiscutata erythropus]
APRVISDNVTLELEHSNLTDMPQVTSDKIWVRRPGRGPFSFTREELQNKDVKDLDDLKKLLLIRIGHDPERTPTDCVAVRHPKKDNLRASTPINELYNDDKSALEVTITNDRDTTIRKQVSEEVIVAVSGNVTQSKQSIVYLS